MEDEFPTLYRKTSTGAIQMWRIWVSESEESQGAQVVYTENGQVDGKIRSDSGVVVREGKQKRSVREQAVHQARAKWKKKADSGYFDSEEKARNTMVVLPMLALNFEKRGHDIEWPAIGQRKFDGIRCTAKLLRDGTISLRSRKSKEFPHLQHIRAAVKSVLGDRRKVVLDGEHYADPAVLSFQQVSGLVRKEYVEDQDLELSTNIGYRLYDLVDLEDLSRVYTNRHSWLVDNCEGKQEEITVVENFDLESSDRVKEMHDRFVTEGFEGLMIRNGAGEYGLNKRSKHLQKFKAFQDEEYRIVGFTEGVGNSAGMVVWRCVTADGKEFDLKPDGSNEKRREWFQNGDSHIGKEITVRFFELTDDGIPRFPTGGWFRDYE